MQTQENLQHNLVHQQQNLDKLHSHSIQIDHKIKLQILSTANTLIELEVPAQWTLNQVKLILLELIPILNFNKFEFQYKRVPLRVQQKKHKTIYQKLSGNTKIHDLHSHQLVIKQTNLNQQYQKIYSVRISQAFKKYKINSQSTLYPILHPKLSKHLTSTASSQRSKNFQERENHPDQNRNEEEGVRIINIIRFFGMFALSNILFELASVFQVVVLLAVILVYLLMQNYVNDNQRNRRDLERNQRIERLGERLAERMRDLQHGIADRDVRQNHQQVYNQPINQNNIATRKQQPVNEQNKNKQQKIHHQDNKQLQENLQHQQNQIQKQKKTRRPILAKFILFLACLTQTIYCYILSIFPNWTVQTHLHANSSKINKILDKVKSLDPEASEMIKNWRKEAPKLINKQKIE